MSDDLISRKAAYKAFSDYLGRSSIGEISARTELSIGEIASVIHSVPTAFDKGKVINDLLSASICSSPDEDSFIEMEEAIEIVEKGGIE